jgi:hypothetical protein
MDLNQLLQSLTGTTDARTKAIEAEAARMTIETDALQQSLQLNVDDARKVSDAAAQIAADKAQTTYVQNKALQEAATIYGMNATESNFVAAQRMAEYTAAEEERKVARAEFDRLSSVGLLDNPLGYIFAQLQLPQAAARNNAIVAKRDAAADDIATRQQLAASQKAVTTASTANSVRATQLAEAENARLAAEIQLRQAQAENSSKISGQRLEAFRLRDKAFDVQGDMFSKALSVQQFQMNFESLQIQREQAKLAAEERAARLRTEAAGKEAERQQMMELDTNFASISKFLGMSVPMNVTVWKALPNQKQKQAWLTAAQTGTIGTDLLTSLQFVSTVGNTAVMQQTNPGVGVAVQGFTQALANAEATIARKPENAKLKLQERLDLATDEYTKLIIDSAKLPTTKQTLTAPQFDTLFNPYKAQHKVLMTDPTLVNNAVTKAMQAATVGADVAQLPNIPADLEQKALQSIILRVRNRELGPDDAAKDIVQYFSKAAKNNYDLYQYTSFGLPAQSNYVARINGLGMFGDPVTADFMNFASTKTAIVKAAALTQPTTAPQFLQGSGGPMGIGAGPALLNLFGPR